MTRPLRDFYLRPLRTGSRVRLRHDAGSLNVRDVAGTLATVTGRSDFDGFANVRTDTGNDWSLPDFDLDRVSSSGRSI